MRSPKPLVIAHRGASGSELENSLAAFRAAAPQGADAVEIDVHATADGAIIVHHDEAVGGMAIADTSAAKIATWRLPNGEPVPTLAQALVAIPRALQVFVEVKDLAPRWDARLLAVLDEGPNPTGYAVHSFDHALVQRLVAQRPMPAAGLLVSSRPGNLAELLASTSASVLWVERAAADEALVRAAHDGGARVFIWTVDEPAELGRLIGWGVDGLCTNFPARARRAVDSPRAA